MRGHTQFKKKGIVVAGQKANHQEALARPRRNFWSLIIEPFKQIKFGMYVIALSVAFVGICALMFVSAFRDQYQHVMKIFNVVDESAKWTLVVNDIFIRNAIIIGVVFVAYLGALMGVIFRLTHRYYGPLVSIERFVDNITAGNYDKRAKIRDKDELQRLVAKLNLMAEALERRHGKKASDAHQVTDSDESVGKAG